MPPIPTKKCRRCDNQKRISLFKRAGIVCEECLTHNDMRFLNCVSYNVHTSSDHGQCWEWHGERRNKKPAFRPNGSLCSAARYAYHAFVQPLDNHERVGHLCGNIQCVNPDHLFRLGVSQGGRVCTNCNIRKDIANYGVRKTGKISSECRSCSTKRTMEWMAKNTERARQNTHNYRRKVMDNVSLRLSHRLRILRTYATRRCEPFSITVDELLESYSETCQSCGVDAGRSINIDHCHKTGKFRAFLCGQCNMALGCSGECPDRLRKLADYIESQQLQ